MSYDDLCASASSICLGRVHPPDNPRHNGHSHQHLGKAPVSCVAICSVYLNSRPTSTAHSPSCIPSMRRQLSSEWPDPCAQLIKCVESRRVESSAGM